MNNTTAPCGLVTLEVFDPFGPAEVTRLFSPRLDTLDGKTIAMSEDEWLVGRAKPLIQELLLRRFPTVTFVDLPGYREMGGLTDAQFKEKLQKAAPRIDGAIVGNAG